MGLFATASIPPWDENADFGSTAHVARLLAAPVVLVVDARPGPGIQSRRAGVRFRLRPAHPGGGR